MILWTSLDQLILKKWSISYTYSQGPKEWIKCVFPSRILIRNTLWTSITDQKQLPLAIMYCLYKELFALYNDRCQRVEVRISTKLYHLLPPWNCPWAVKCILSAICLGKLNDPLSDLPLEHIVKIQKNNPILDLYSFLQLKDNKRSCNLIMNVMWDKE